MFLRPPPGQPQTHTHTCLHLVSCRSYQHFCRCGRTLDARLEALGGARLAPRADINREDWAAIDAWIEGVLAALAGLALQSMAELGGMEAPAADGRGAEAAPIKRCSIGRCLVMLTAQLPPLFLFSRHRQEEKEEKEGEKLRTRDSEMRSKSLCHR